MHAFRPARYLIAGTVDSPLSIIVPGLQQRLRVFLKTTWNLNICLKLWTLANSGIRDVKSGDMERIRSKIVLNFDFSITYKYFIYQHRLKQESLQSAFSAS